MKNRIKQLIDKMLSIKGLFALTSSILFIVKETEYYFIAYLISWCTFIFGREVFKIVCLLRGIKNEPSENTNKENETI